MIPPRLLGFLLISVCCGLVIEGSEQEPSIQPQHIKELSLKELEEHRDAIERELSRLAHYSLRSGVGSIGYRSNAHTDGNQFEWIQVNLESEAIIEEIVLVPTIWRDTERGFSSDGFPFEFKIIAGKESNAEGYTIASFDQHDQTQPRIAPLIIACESVSASWIRLEAKKLSPRAYDGKFNLQFAEIMVFGENENLALEAEVQTSSGQIEGAGAWNRKFLTDSFLPYLMDSAEGEQSISFVSFTGIGDQPSMIIDLGSSYNLDQINLHTVDQSDTVPQAFVGEFGVPKWLVVEGAIKEDFSDARLLLDFKQNSIFEIAPIIMKRLRPHPSRYIRLTAKEPYVFEGVNIDGTPLRGTRLGFAEIELYADNKNVALGKPVNSEIVPVSPVRRISALTDGRNLYGSILNLRDWMHQLSRRHDLEVQLPLVTAELALRYDRQEIRLRILSWVIAALFAGTIFYVLITRHLKEKAIFGIRNRIAADLHDELGANLYAVSMLGELAAKAKDDPEKVQGLIARMRALTQRTSKAVKYCTNILETPGLYADFEDAMIRNADRLLADLDHKLVFEAEDMITKMRAGKRIDLFLFYKECLINIIRHSGATKAETRLKTEGKNLHLQVSDNGKGFPNSTESHIPVSLKRRAKLLGGKVTIVNPQSGGAQIHLLMNI